MPKPDSKERGIGKKCLGSYSGTTHGVSKNSRLLFSLSNRTSRFLAALCLDFILYILYTE